MFEKEHLIDGAWGPLYALARLQSSLVRCTVFCGQCGGNVPDESKFCLKCGRAVSVAASTSVTGGAAAAPAMAKEPAVAVESKPRPYGIALWFLIPLFGLVIWWAGWNSASHNRDTRTTVPQEQAPQPQPHTQTVTNTAFTVDAGQFRYYKFSAPEGATDVRLQGRFAAKGGSGKDIEVYVMTEDAYVNWQNGHSGNTFYNSGRLTQDSLNVDYHPTEAPTSSYSAIASLCFRPKRSKRACHCTISGEEVNQLQNLGNSSILLRP